VSPPDGGVRPGSIPLVEACVRPRVDHPEMSADAPRAAVPERVSAGKPIGIEVDRRRFSHFLRGRLRFSGSEQGAPFPSALATWGASQGVLRAVDESLPGHGVPADSVER
jgi:hypothetical protein